MASEDQDKHLPTLAPGPRGPITLGSTTVSRPKKNSTACLPCKQAKRKCSGRPAPCESCKNTNADCVFDETLDLRRKVAAKRNLEELAYYKSLLYALLDSLRSPGESEVGNVLGLIRGCPSLNDIAAAVGGPTIDISDASFEEHKSILEELSSLAGSEDSMHLDPHSRITLEKLCDIPLFQVPAKPWTTVTEDSQLVSHLVSLYFTWDHPLIQIVDQKLFLQHMKIGAADSEFCTPLLANSIFAMASTYSDFPDVFAMPGEVASRGEYFYREADRLWRAEEGRATLTNIQAVALMSYVLRCQGKAQLGWLKLKQAVQLAQDFGLFQKPRALLQHGMTADQQHVAAITAWGLLIMNSHVSMDLHRAAYLKPPTSKLTNKEVTDAIMWSPYPLTNRLDCCRRPGLLQYAMMKLAELTVMAVDIQEIMFDRAFEMTVDELWAAANQYLSHLERWLVVLMSEHEDDSQLMPHILFLQIRCHYNIMSMFNHFLEHAAPKQRQDSPQLEQARSIQLQAARAIGNCLHYQREVYGLAQIPRYLLEAVNSSCLVLITDLSNKESHGGFRETCRYLVAMKRRMANVKEMIEKIESLVGVSTFAMAVGLTQLVI